MRVSIIEATKVSDLEEKVNAELRRLEHHYDEVIDIKYHSYPSNEQNYSSYSAMIIYK